MAGHVADELHGELRKALSTLDMQQLCPNSKICMYSDFANARTLRDAMGPDGSAVFLYLHSPSAGHWCTVFLRSPTVVEVFDPYGIQPDSELDWTKPVNAKLGQERPWLSQLLAPFKTIVYNDHPLQTRRDLNIATCGRHCAARLAHRDMSIDEYAAYLKKLGDGDPRMTPDVIVTLLTTPELAEASYKQQAPAAGGAGAAAAGDEQQMHAALQAALHMAGYYDMVDRLLGGGGADAGGRESHEDEDYEEEEEEEERRPYPDLASMVERQLAETHKRARAGTYTSNPN